MPASHICSNFHFLQCSIDKTETQDKYNTHTVRRLGGTGRDWQPPLCQPPSPLGSLPSPPTARAMIWVPAVCLERACRSLILAPRSQHPRRNVHVLHPRTWSGPGGVEGVVPQTPWLSSDQGWLVHCLVASCCWGLFTCGWLGSARRGGGAECDEQRRRLVVVGSRGVGGWRVGSQLYELSSEDCLTVPWLQPVYHLGPHYLGDIKKYTQTVDIK